MKHFCPQHVRQGTLNLCYDQEFECGILVGLLKCGIILFIFAFQ